MRRQNWIPYAATAVIALLLMPFLQHSAQLMFLLASVAAICAAATCFKLVKPEDPFDLRRLKEIDEQEQVAQLEVEEPGDYDSVHCLHCGTVYSMRFPTCPHCGQR